MAFTSSGGLRLRVWGVLVDHNAALVIVDLLQPFLPASQMKAGELRDTRLLAVLGSRV